MNRLNLSFFFLAVATATGGLPQSSSAVELPEPKTTTRADFLEFGELLVGDWTSSGTFIADWPGDSANKKGEQYTGTCTFRWAANKLALIENQVIGDASIPRVYTWNPETKIMSATGVTSAGNSWKTIFWKDGGQWKWVHREPETNIVGYGDTTLGNTVHDRRGKLFQGDQELLPYNDVYQRTNVRLGDLKPLLGRFQVDLDLFFDFAGAKKGDFVTFIQDASLTEIANVIELRNYIVDRGVTKEGSVELHRFDEKLGTTTVVGASSEGVLQGKWRMADAGKTLILDWTWGDATGQTELKNIGDTSRDWTFRNVHLGTGPATDAETITMQRVDISPARIAEVRKTVDYFLGEWKSTRTIDGHRQTDTMKVVRAPDGHGHLVTQHGDSGDFTGLLDFDTATGRWAGHWHSTTEGVYGHEVWPDFEPGPLKVGDKLSSRQTSMISGQRGLATWLYEIKSDDHFTVRSIDATLAGEAQPETVMEFRRR